MAHKVAKATSIANWKKPRLVAEVTRLQRRVQIDGAERQHAEIDAERLQNAADDASEGFALYDAEERLVYANKKYHEFFPEVSHLLQPGTPRNEVRRAYYASGAVAGAQGRVEEFIEEELERRLSARGPVELQRADGTWLKLSDHRLADGSMVLVRTDITEQKRAAEALRESEARLAEAQRIAHVGNWEWNLETDRVQWSDENFRIFGFEVGAIDPTGQTFDAILHPDDRKETLEAVERALHEGAPYDREYRIVRPDGEVRDVHALAEVTFDETGKPVRMAGTIQDNTERKITEVQLESLSHYDALTSLANRNLFLTNLEHDLANAARSDRPLAVLRLDLDGFEAVNHALGHHAGDHLLKEVAGRLKARCRQSDTVARLSGDEFAVLVTNLANSGNVDGIADNILKRLSEPIILDGQEVHTGASIGVSVHPNDEGDADDLLTHADMAMHQAKAKGGNNVRYFDENMRVDAQTRRELEVELRQALEREEFVVHFQPIYDFDSGRFVMAEALIRWMHPQRGLVAPGEFIPVAESTGLIVAIGERVLHSACAECHWWQTHGFPEMRVAVNLSPVQLYRSDIVTAMTGALEKSGLNPHDLEIEITESSIMQDLEQANVILRRLNALGIEISLDDFGTGYSSLSLLKRVPVDKLKIDRSFVSGVVANRDDREITKAVIRLADSLNLSVTAEGIENEEQFQLLHAEGCDQAQGYYFARPLPHDDFVPWLREQADGWRH